MEEWKIVYINKNKTNYEISNFGRCRNTSKLEWKTEGILKPKYNKQNGYISYGMVWNSHSYYRYAHRLVAEYFIEGDNKLHVNHIDGNKQNNTQQNLEWVTQKQNMKHAFDNDMVSTVKSIKQYSLNGKYINTYKSISEASRSTNVNISSISSCVCGNNSTSGRYQWRYEDDTEPVLNVLDSTTRYCTGVVKLDLTGKYIKEYDSITEAYKEMGKIDNGTISAVCKGKRGKFAGFKWMYKDSYYKQTGTGEDIVYPI